MTDPRCRKDDQVVSSPFFLVLKPSELQYGPNVVEEEDGLSNRLDWSFVAHLVQQIAVVSSSFYKLGDAELTLNDSFLSLSIHAREVT